MRPVLEYSGSVWDPSGVGLQNELEKVQNRAARFATENYYFETGSMTGSLEHLKWESLKKRRRDSRLILLYKGLKGKASIPTDDLIPLVKRCRNDHSMAYQVPIANTDIYKCSFSPRDHLGLECTSRLSYLLFLFVLRFYGPVKSCGHVEPVSYPLTLFLGRLKT